MNAKTKILVLTSSFPDPGPGDSFFAEEGWALNEVFCATFAPALEPKVPSGDIDLKLDVVPRRRKSRLKELSIALLHFPLAPTYAELCSLPRKFKTRENMLLLLKEALQIGLRLGELQRAQCGFEFIYSFWGRTDAVVASVLSKKNRTRFAYRSHGFDLYEEHYGGYIPFKRYLAATDGVEICLTHSAANYSRQRYGTRHCEVFPLGANLVPVHGEQKQRSSLDFLSVSHIVPIKRVELVARVMTSLAGLTQRNIAWTHVGGSGRQFEECLRRAKVPGETHLKVTHIPSTSQSEVLRIMDQGKHGVLINLSASEGMPVSILEAMSARKAIVAPMVGGIPELLESTQNLLVQSEADEVEIATLVLSWIQGIKLAKLGKDNEMLARSRYEARSCAAETISLLRELSSGGKP